jgi:hypothetical protein
MHSDTKKYNGAQGPVDRAGAVDLIESEETAWTT